MRTSKIASLMLLLGLATTSAACSHKSQAGPGSGPRVIPMAVTANGFEPTRLTVKAGQPLKLVVTRQTEAPAPSRSSSPTTASTSRCR